ncbi:Dynein_intermediate chain [Hexamita inflata]|uniref:Dynein intermediate chain n=1 Tax=Hexamita inflata TaxID=28002 RepID=A0AA86TZK7_9EUKA|nr:Dynein intermediate chain [Hexamita inflata]CAI9934524.1 Dynein intermediate chain [Hexamita inflata]CAI9950932.1 Dynein intermediate chain [Hexamita inflata]
MDTQHIYTRPKRYFGMDLPRDKLQLLDTRDVLNDHPELEKRASSFEQLANVSRGVQHIPDMSEHMFNSESVQMIAHEILNKAATEEPEQVLRLRKKAEREQNYIAAVASQSRVTTPALQINNAQDCTTQYFNSQQAQPTQKPQIHVQAMFKDPEIVKRPLNQVVFQPEVNRPPQKFVACYGRAFQPELLNGVVENATLQSTSNAYIFDVQNSSHPELTLYSNTQINTIQYSQKDYHVLFAGLESGVVAMYDTRKSGYAVNYSDIQYSHKSQVTDLKILKSKSASEFVTVGTDGQILFWDCRSLTKPIEGEVYSIDFNQDKSLQFPLQALNCESKLLAGSSSGHIFTLDKKAKPPTCQAILGHSGAVRTVQRHAAHPKYFASCGDHSIKFYSDDAKIPIMSFVSPQRYVDFRLSASRPGVFVGCRLNGGIDVYDMFRNAAEPVLSTQLFSTSECTCMDFDSTGRYLLTGTVDGLIALSMLSPSLVSNTTQQQDKNERNWILNLFEREQKRSRLLEGRAKPKAAGSNEEKLEIIDLELEKRVDQEFGQMFGE